MATRTATTHTFYIGVGDEIPYLREQILQSNGSPLDLSSGVSNLAMRLWKKDSGAVTEFTLTGSVFVVVSGLESQGYVECRWLTGGITVAGEYYRRWFGKINGKQFSMPNYLDTGYNVMVS